MTTPPTDANRIALEQAQLAARRDAFASVSHEDDYEDDDSGGGGGGGDDDDEAAPTTTSATRSSNSSSTVAAATTTGVEPPAKRKKTRGRVKIEMQFIQDKMRRYTTFSKRKSGIMKKVSSITGRDGRFSENDEKSRFSESHVYCVRTESHRYVHCTFFSGL